MKFKSCLFLQWMYILHLQYVLYSTATSSVIKVFFYFLEWIFHVKINKKRKQFHLFLLQMWRPINRTKKRYNKKRMFYPIFQLQSSTLDLQTSLEYYFNAGQNYLSKTSQFLAFRYSRIQLIEQCLSVPTIFW